MSFTSARDAIRALIAADAANPAIDPRGYPRFYEHGTQTARCIVLFHGLTNCPQQFDELAQQLYAGGDNVYVPRLTGHGYKDRHTRAPAALVARNVEACATEAADHAHGLGETTAVAGISVGGTMALWLAQTGAVDNAVALAPFLMVPVVPRGLGMLVMRLLLVLPNGYLWWDPRKRDRMLPPYAYPGLWTHCLAQCVLAGAAVFAAAGTGAPKGRHCSVVINAQDPAVNNAVTRELVDRWQRDGAPFGLTVWGDLGAVHDVIDPTTYPAARTRVYPHLVALLDKDAGTVRNKSV